MYKYKKLDIKNIGAKAFNLNILEENNFNVPKWFVIPNEMLNNLDKNAKKQIEKFISKEFSNVEIFSVRTSSEMEDSEKFSYAGQFDTYLNIKKEKIISIIEKILNDLKEKNIDFYSGSKEKNGIGIIIQEMINPQKSGVLFSANPQGLLNETVIVVGQGVGENVVEDKLDTVTYYYNLTDDLYYYSKQDNAKEMLSSKEINELIGVSKKIKDVYKIDIDVEWAIKDDFLYILQTRPITTIKNKETIILDNSNIVESYPYITLPLTQSYVKKAYSTVFKKCFERVLSKKTLKYYDSCFDNMVECVNGRMYYRISNWYTIIQALPCGNKIIPIWQEMLGVSNKEISSKKVKKISVFQSFLSILKCGKLIIANNRNMKNLSLEFKEVINYYNEKYNENLNNNELIDIFDYLVEKTSQNWDITLINDMYAFIFTHFLNKRIKKVTKENYKIITNQLITQKADIDSMKPLEELKKISAYVKKDESLFNDLKSLKSDEEYYRYIKTNPKLKLKFDVYIKKYGDRCLEELKFESKTFRSSPILLVEKVLLYASMHNEKNKFQNIEKFDIKTKGLTNYYIKNASIGIKNRENSRLNRSRIFGMVRNIFYTIADNLYKNKEIDTVQDIFYLTYEEIIKYIKENKFDIKKIISERKNEYENFKQLPTYSRLIFDGNIFNKTQSNIKVKANLNSKNKLLGEPCSSGEIIGECLIVKDPKEVKDCFDKILVTKMTDPGWIFLLSMAKGVISEKGSILSHTAIISRELNITSVVGVKNATEILENGDIIKLDGNNGEIEILEKRVENV